MNYRHPIATLTRRLSEGVIHTARIQWHCITQDLTQNALPWHNPCPQCRSLLAGGSGCLYALPLLVCPSNSEKMLWVLQAVFSVWADYFQIHTNSVAHGLDRVFATLMTVRMVRGSMLL